MIAIAVGLGALVVWQVLEAVLGYPLLSGAKRVVRRLASGLRAVVCLALATIGAIDQGQRGARRTFVKYDMEANPPRWAVRLGTIGWIAKGAVLLVVSGLFWFTALSTDAAKSGSMDLALRTLRAQPFGGWLLAFVSVGFACFGAFCFVWSRHARQDVSSRS
jgi:hypothetical protein